MTLDRPWLGDTGEPFRELLVHPRVSAVLNHILGEGFRLVHGPELIAMDPGTEGGLLHGGGYSPDGR